MHTPLQWEQFDKHLLIRGVRIPANTYTRVQLIDLVYNIYLYSLLL